MSVPIETIVNPLADITGDLRRIPFAIGLSRRMRRIIRFSIAFALSVIAMLAILTLTTGIPLTLGVIGHEGSTVIVVLAGLTLLAFRQNSRRHSPAPVPGLAPYPTQQSGIGSSPRRPA